MMPYTDKRATSLIIESYSIKKLATLAPVTGSFLALYLLTGDYKLM